MISVLLDKRQQINHSGSFLCCDQGNFLLLPLLPPRLPDCLPVQARDTGSQEREESAASGCGGGGNYPIWNGSIPM
jgi:hypothetical protein